MKFTITTLLVFVTTFAIAFAMVSKPTAIGADAVYILHMIAACTALIVARYTTGSVHAFALAFGVFGLVTPIMSACPYSLQMWIHENVTFDGPDSLEFGNGWEQGPHLIIRRWFDLLVALFAAFLTSSLIGGLGVVPDKGNNTDAEE